MLGYHETMRRGQASVTLHPAGHMLGSAQLLFEHHGTTLLYTGDIKLRQAGGAAPTHHVVSRWPGEAPAS